jgi:hypothetical protein
MNICSAARSHMKAFTAMFFILSLLVLTPSVHASIVFYGDFEDGVLKGGLSSTSGGSGSTGMEIHNASQMASVRLLNTNDRDILGTYDYYIDNSQHSSANLGDFYASTIASLLFWVQGQTALVNYRSTTQVGVDDVQVEAVPIPSAVLLLGSGLMGLLGVIRGQR